ncbi:MAG: SH3 domain-containing protein, partial [Pararhodobacter sp.]
MMFRLLILLALLAGPAAAQDFPAMHRVVDVVAGDVLNVRAEPNARAQIVGRFERTQTGIEVVGLSENGNWGLVRSGEGIGWSSIRYLQRERSDSWRDGEQELTCLGTEPFWTLTFFLPDNRAEYIAPDDSFEMRTDAPNLPGTQFPPTLALPFQGAREGTAVVRNGICSDGMSDQLFGLE